MAKYRPKRGIIFYLFVFVIAAIMALGVLFVYRFTNKFTMPFQFFYVEHNNDMILYKKSLAFEKDNEYRFDCKDTLLFLNSKDNQCRGYSVNIYPNPNIKSFSFTVDGFSRSYASIGDMSTVFDITLENTYFTIKPVLDMQGIIEALHPDKEIVLPNINFNSDYYFLLTIGNIDNNAFVYIEFKIT